MTAARCEQTELLAAECAHCTGATIAGDPATLTIAYTFAAGHAGECAHCGEPFDRGQTIARCRGIGNERGIIVCPTCTRKASR